MLLRDLIIDRLNDIGNKKCDLLYEEDKAWGVCFQVDEFLHKVTGEHQVIEEWIVSCSESYKKWKGYLDKLGEYVPYSNPESFSNEDRYDLCLLLADEISKDGALFTEIVPVVDNSLLYKIDTRDYRDSVIDFNISWEDV